MIKPYPGKFHGMCRINHEDPAAADHLSHLKVVIDHMADTRHDHPA
nr:hypothetical protein [uncultured Albidiferax sp.]